MGYIIVLLIKLKDAKLEACGLDKKNKGFTKNIKKSPYKTPILQLVGDLKGYYSRRINIQHRIVYEVYEER